MPRRLADNVVSWASELDEATAEQAARTARLPIVEGHVALMADAHLGLGATVGSVIPTRGAVIPAAVGVDIGCGMIAARTRLRATDLPDDLRPLLDGIAAAVPAGVGEGHAYGRFAEVIERTGRQPHTPLSDKQQRTAARQYGTLGSGNHFLEICLDAADRVWAVLHSGSRGIGNQLAQQHISAAKGLMRRQDVALEDPDLAYLVQGTPAFDAYLSDLLWAQEYAAGNREAMMGATLQVVADQIRDGDLDAVVDGDAVINCHHNYTAQEEHHGQTLWITRKGAIRARRGDLGIVPGSMGTGTYIVRGRGSPEAYQSSAHGAGRRMSRRAARRRFREADLVTAMGDRTWLSGKARALVDEIPAAYKDIEQVMGDQRDLVEVVEVLRQILNYKGT